MSKMNRRALKKYVADEIERIKKKDNIEGKNPKEMLA